jgi:hypothetical protein
MKLRNTRLQILQTKKDFSQEVKTGVSLHCHTQYSKEMLDFIPHYTERLPIIRHYWRKARAEYIKREGKDIDFESAYWSPPLSEHDVYQIEKAQIESLGINPMVAISDHDEIEGNLKICAQTSHEIAPISLEWTVPFEYGFFHVGVHNLPPGQAVELSQQLLEYTFDRETQTDERLHELFAMLNEMPEILIIFNHPLWDIELVGKERHEILLKHFIKEFGRWFHAFEINGFRTWSENKAVIELAESYGIPLCSGGDRHGCQPNTVLNLTNTATFSEFVDEVRTGKHSEVVLMPEYNLPLNFRQLQGFAEILNTYEHLAEDRRRWVDRVFFDKDGQGLRPLKAYGWRKGGPRWVRASIGFLKLLGHPALRSLYKVLRKREDIVPKSIDEEDFVIENHPLLTDNDTLITS